ncbi:type II toxin-antitoxin system HipA family toxin, partial [Candidatus Nomurabacteria bacterium]|nr:type II toxin-antitoxin system HipA family toxin [Candidatus Nomurabacteria bacterium]
VLTESDFLLGVYDRSRIGALRFSLIEGGPFLADEVESSAPPWTTLRSLETASAAFESGDDLNEEKWLKQLLAPGSSLGGARPKASVQAPDGSLWIAKFPSKNDEWNSGAWEMVVHDLALRCMLNVPDAKLENFSDTGSTYIVKRFDRQGDIRFHFASAMALLGKTDGRGSEGASYLDIASLIKSSGAYPENDLIELWKRVVFSIAVSNTDDHLRNHGLLLTDRGWTLSPMYDVNPNIYGTALSLNISQNENTMDIDLALETARFYGIGLKDAKETAEVILKTVRDNWINIALVYGIGRNLIRDMEAAFIYAGTIKY